MLKQVCSLLFVLSAGVLAACSDMVTPPAPAESSAIAGNPLGNRAAAGPDTLATYGCLITTANPDRPGWWRYQRQGLEFPTAARAHKGEKLRLSFRRRAADGTPVFVANCLIPRTGQSVAMMKRWLNVSPGARGHDDGSAGEAVLLSDAECEWNERGECVFNPIVAIAEPPNGEGPDDSGVGSTPVTTSPTSPDGGSSGGGTDGSSPCTNCSYDSALLTCTSGVMRGATVTCRVNATDLRSTTARNWSFTPENSSLSTVPGPASALSWSGPGIASGKVRVDVSDNAGTRTVEYPFSVFDRGWTWANKATSEYRDGTGDPCLNHTPTWSTGHDVSRANGINMEIGYGCSSPRRMIQPDSYDTGDGFTVTTVSGGPNQGYHYVSGATLRLRRESTYNQGTLPGAHREVLRDVPGYALNDITYSQKTVCGSMANWHEFTRCSGLNPEEFIAAVRAHEGHGTMGNNGHYSAAKKAMEDRANDPMIYFDGVVGGRTVTNATFTTTVRAEFHERAKEADDHTLHTWEGGRVGGNWSGPVWLWMPLEGRFHKHTHSN